MTESHSFVVPHKPQVKGRPRMSRRGKVYTPAATLEFEGKVASSYDGPKFEKPEKLSVIIDLFKDRAVVRIIPIDDFENESKLRGDVDNYAKAFLDGMNGEAFDDDSQVVDLRVRKH